MNKRHPRRSRGREARSPLSFQLNPLRPHFRRWVCISCDATASTLSETLTRLTRAGHTILEVRLEETRLDEVVRALLREEKTP